MTWITRSPPGVRIAGFPTTAVGSREQVLERVLRTVLNDGGLAGDDGDWVAGQRRNDIGVWTGARGFIRAPELKQWDQLGLDF